MTRRAGVLVILALLAAFLFGACAPVCWNGDGYGSCQQVTP